MEMESDLQVRNCGSPQERVTAPGWGAQALARESFLKERPGRMAVGHQADAEQEGGLEGTFLLSLPHVQRPRMFIPW